MPLPAQNVPSRPADFLLVLPAYRELKRLPRYLFSLKEALASAPWTTEIAVVDDGSPPGEQQALAEQIRPGQYGRCHVLPLRLMPRNRLKGDAILEGWRSRPARWLSFADADGATGAAEVLRVFREIAAQDPSQQAAYFGVRQGPGPKVGRRSAVRRLMSGVFSRLAGLALGATPIDFQCGFKVVPGPLFPRIADKLGDRGLCFDLALFLALRSEGVPVRLVAIDWREQPGGRVNPWRHGPGMVAGLWSLARNGLDPKAHRRGDR